MQDDQDWAASARRDPEPTLDNERADDCFNSVINYAHAAANEGNAAGYNAAINALRWAASVLNPEKYGNKATSGGGDPGGYLIDTGIRRETDPGYMESGALPHETAQETGVPDQARDLQGQDLNHVVGLNERPVTIDREFGGHGDGEPIP